MKKNINFEFVEPFKNLVESSAAGGAHNKSLRRIGYIEIGGGGDLWMVPALYFDLDGLFQAATATFNNNFDDILLLYKNHCQSGRYFDVGQVGSAPLLKFSRHSGRRATRAKGVPRFLSPVTNKSYIFSPVRGRPAQAFRISSNGPAGVSTAVLAHLNISFIDTQPLDSVLAPAGLEEPVIIKFPIKESFSFLLAPGQTLYSGLGPIIKQLRAAMRRQKFELSLYPENSSLYNQCSTRYLKSRGAVASLQNFRKYAKKLDSKNLIKIGFETAITTQTGTFNLKIGAPPDDKPPSPPSEPRAYFAVRMADGQFYVIKTRVRLECPPISGTELNFLKKKFTNKKWVVDVFSLLSPKFLVKDLVPDNLAALRHEVEKALKLSIELRLSGSAGASGETFADQTKYLLKYGAFLMLSMGFQFLLDNALNKQFLTYIVEERGLGKLKHFDYGGTHVYYILC